MNSIKIALFGHDINTKSTLIPFKENTNIELHLFCPSSKKHHFHYYALDKQSIPYTFYDDVNGHELHTLIETYSPHYIVSSGLCDKLPDSLIQLPLYDALNIHPSLLPLYRGPNPWFWIIKNGDTHSGITIHKLTRDFDQGDIVYQLKFPLGAQDTLGSLLFKSSYFIEQALLGFMPLLENQTYDAIPQSGGTYYSQPSQQDKTISWNNTAVSIENLVKAGNPGIAIMGSILGQPYHIIECSATTIPSTADKIIIKNERLYIPASDFLVEIRILNAKTFGIISGRQFLNLAGLL